jgi:aspartate carbamoyltransferase catalytic subunit
VRHPCAGAPKILADLLPAAVINAGDGAHEHPTQALLDAFTIREKKQTLQGLKVAIVGDITHSRVARSNILLLLKMGAEVAVSGPGTMVPPFIEELGVCFVPDIADVIRDADVIMMLRIQMERQGRNLFPSVREYSRFFGLNRGLLKNAKNDVLIMHPGPVNRGVEISPDVLDAPYTVILDQVTNGVAIRMALMYLLIGR